jgi:hypothetical protein
VGGFENKEIRAGAKGKKKCLKCLKLKNKGRRQNTRRQETAGKTAEDRIKRMEYWVLTSAPILHYSMKGSPSRGI